MNSPKILIAAGCPIGTTPLYRCIHLQEQLAQKGIPAFVQEWYSDDALRIDDALRYDILVLQRVAINDAVRRLIDQAHAQGKMVVFDTDDLIFEPKLTAWHRAVARLSADEQVLYADGVRRYLATLEASDYVLTATPVLAELAQQRGKIAFVQRNAVGHAMQAIGDRWLAQRQTRAAQARVVIGYGSGTPTHDIDFEQTVPALLDVMAHYPQVELWIVGPLLLPPALSVFNMRIRRFPLTDWQGWFEVASQFDINLAPLEANNIFCRAKSEIKFVEAGLLGIPTVASRIDAFEYAITDGQDGLLAGNLVEWMEALDRLVRQPALRAAMGAAARRTVEARYSVAARADDLAPLLEKLLTPAQADLTLPRRAQAADPVLDASVPLVLNWIISEPFLGSGGYMSVFRMIKLLGEFGHECHVYVMPMQQMFEYSAEQLRHYVDQHFMITNAVFHRWTGKIQDADATFATYWTTVKLLLNLPNPGRLYYLVQDFEPYFYAMGSDYILAENTYRQGLHCITLGPWLAKLMRERYHAEADHFDFAVDVNIYRPQTLARSSNPRIAFYARPSTPRRAYEIGISALSIVKAQAPNAEIVLYGATELVPPPPFPFTNRGVCHPYELADLYATCDVGLVLSLTNPSLVPFEMMACRCAVVDMQSERVEGLLEHGQNAMLAEPTPEKLADAILQLLWDKELRAQIIERAYAQVHHTDWRSSARQIEQVLLRHAPALDQRCLSRRLQGNEEAVVLEQIQRLLKADEQRVAEIDQLQMKLQRAMLEKAQLANQVQQTEQAFNRINQGISLTPRRTWQFMQHKTVENVPLWLLGNRRLSKLSITQAPLRQSFIADRAQLSRLTLWFAACQPMHTGTLHFELVEGDGQEPLLVTQSITSAEISPDQPYAIDFTPQNRSYGRTFTFTITGLDAAQDRSPKGAGTNAYYALWRFWQPIYADAHLQRAGQMIRGQIVFQPFYGIQHGEQTSLLPARIDPALWAEAVRFSPTVIRQSAARSTQETVRLTKQTWHALQARGINGLLADTAAYVQWRLANLRKGQ